MKTILLTTLIFVASVLFAQVPNSFKYQAVTRNSSGEVLPNQNVSFRMSILQGGTIVYTETFSETTNDFGLVNLNIGEGASTLGDFSNIDWAVGSYSLKIELDETGGASYSEIGTSTLVTVPFAMYSKDVQTKQILNFNNDTLFLTDGGQIYLGDYSSQWQQNADGIYFDESGKYVGVGTDNLTSKFVVQGDATSDLDSALFEVKNKDGQTIFAVYDGGVRIYVNDDPAKANTDKGGFAVGGYRTNKAISNEYMRVTPDSVRIYIREDDGTKANTDKGGFAVGGYRTNKTLASDYFNIGSTDSTEIIDPSEARIMWYPFKEAFLAGRVIIEHQDSIGFNSFSVGYECKAIGDYSQALGYRAKAKGVRSIAIGDHATTLGEASYAFGDSSIAKGYGSYAFGSRGIDSITVSGVDISRQTIANGDYSFAMGFGAYADSSGSVAIGAVTSALGSHSVAIGLWDTTYAPLSFVIGLHSKTYGMYSTAIGNYNEVRGEGSFGIGSYNSTDSSGAVAIGTSCNAIGAGAFAIGIQDTASANGALSMGYRTKASGSGSTAFGTLTESTASVSTSFGFLTHATANYSTSFGASSIASGTTSTAFGAGTAASGTASTSFGSTTVASGDYSTAFGRNTVANGETSTAIGEGMTVNGDNTVGISLSSGSYSITNSNIMSIMGGNVGIGTTAPGRPLQVVGSSEAAARFTLMTPPGTGGSGTIVEFYSKTSTLGFPSLTGSITVNNSGVLTYGTFTGSHLVIVDEETVEGMIISLNGNNEYIDNKNQTGEIIYGGIVNQVENASNIIGSYFGEQEISGERKSDLIMAVGNGSMWLVDNGEDVQIGDYLISSSVKGHATKDMGTYQVANIIARVAEPVDWSKETKMINGVKHKLVSVFFENFKLYHNDKKIDELENRINELEKLIKLSTAN